MEYFFIDPDTLINEEECKSFFTMAICTICNGILIEPMQCQKCENCFCNECITKWAQKSTKCPFQCEKFILKPSKTLKRLMTNMKFKCFNGCEELVPYSDYETHRLTTCKKLNVEERYNNLIAELNRLSQENSDLKKNAYKLPNGSISSFLFKSKHHNHGLMLCTTLRDFASCNKCQASISQNEEVYYCSFCDFDFCISCKKKEEAINQS